MVIRWLRYLLFPFSFLFACIVRVRNFCYQKKWLHTQSYDFPILLVGNVHVGGTGKTPMVSYLVNWLQNEYYLAVLSRGYGRKTKGYIQADDQSTAESIGDEPLQLYRNFGNQVLISVCENRNIGVQNLMPQCEIIVMDDAFQHRRIQAGWQIVILPFETFFTPQFILPTGNLREPVTEHRRAQMVVVSKCPTKLDSNQKAFILKKIHPKLAPNTYFTTLEYKNLQALFSTAVLTLSSLATYESIFLITGIAHPEDLVGFLLAKNPNILHTTYGDHHNFSNKELEKFILGFHQHPAQKKLIVTTEKDAQRLKNNKFENLLRNLPIYYLPIEVAFLEQRDQDFKHKIINYVETYSRNS